ncbi:hypothetical protein B0H13DRAFT_1850206 [Mycena leptocephala]|nr:hypothetical protein B0H13DRAFT_1850206 [Mycena leptocephala]
MSASHAASLLPNGSLARKLPNQLHRATRRVYGITEESFAELQALLRHWPMRGMRKGDTCSLQSAQRLLKARSVPHQWKPPPIKILGGGWPEQTEFLAVTMHDGLSETRKVCLRVAEPAWRTSDGCHAGLLATVVKILGTLVDGRGLAFFRRRRWEDFVKFLGRMLATIVLERESGAQLLNNGGPVQAATQHPFVGCYNFGDGNDLLPGAPWLHEMAFEKHLEYGRHRVRPRTILSAKFLVMDQGPVHREQIFDDEGAGGKLFVIGDGECWMMSQQCWPFGEPLQDRFDQFLGLKRQENVKVFTTSELDNAFLYYLMVLMIN